MGSSPSFSLDGAFLSSYFRWQFWLSNKKATPTLSLTAAAEPQQQQRKKEEEEEPQAQSIGINTKHKQNFNDIDRETTQSKFSLKKGAFHGCQCRKEPRRATRKITHQPKVEMEDRRKMYEDNSHEKKTYIHGNKNR